MSPPSGTRMFSLITWNGISIPYKQSALFMNTFLFKFFCVQAWRCVAVYFSAVCLVKKILKKLSASFRGITKTTCCGCIHIHSFAKHLHFASLFFPVIVGLIFCSFLMHVLIFVFVSPLSVFISLVLC